MTFAIHMVYGPHEAAHIKQVLIPALAASALDDIVVLWLVNYAAPTPLFGDGTVGKVTVRDVSASRAPGRIGFGEGINFLFHHAKPNPYFLVLNPDTVPDPQLFPRLIARFEAGRTGIVEARQWPSEHPKEYDEATGRTPWATGACMLVGSDVFEALGGFDPLYFLYQEDVDLSWRVWLAGQEVIYAPEASVMHFTGLLSYRHDRYYREHFYSARNFLALAYKFFGEKGERRARRLLNRSSYPRAFKATVWEEYLALRGGVTPLTESPRHAMIKLAGFNLYHRLRAV